MAVLVVHAAAVRTVEDGGPAAAVAAHLGLEGLEDAEVGLGDGHDESLLGGVGGQRESEEVGESGAGPRGQRASGAMRYSTSGSCGPSGNWPASNSTSRSSRAP